MNFTKKQETTYSIGDKNRIIKLGNYSAGTFAGDCLWIDDELCIDLKTLKILYKMPREERLGRLFNEKNNY